MLHLLYPSGHLSPSERVSLSGRPPKPHGSPPPMLSSTSSSTNVNQQNSIKIVGAVPVSM